MTSENAEITVIKESLNLNYENLGNLVDPEGEEAAGMEIEIEDDKFVTLWVIIKTPDMTRNGDFSFNFDVRTAEVEGDGGFNLTYLIPILVAAFFIIGFIIGGVVYAKRRFANSGPIVEYGEYHPMNNEDDTSSAHYQTNGEEEVPLSKKRDKNFFKSGVSGTTFDQTIVTNDL